LRTAGSGLPDIPLGGLGGTRFWAQSSVVAIAFQRKIRQLLLEPRPEINNLLV
jgi:hypothetical protein